MSTAAAGRPGMEDAPPVGEGEEGPIEVQADAGRGDVDVTHTAFVS